MTSVTCIVADDHPAVLEAVAEFLAFSGIEVVGRARDGEEALEKIEARKPSWRSSTSGCRSSAGSS